MADKGNDSRILTRPRVKYLPGYWSEHKVQWALSGLGVREYCRENNLPYGTARHHLTLKSKAETLPAVIPPAEVERAIAIHTRIRATAADLITTALDAIDSELDMVKNPGSELNKLLFEAELASAQIGGDRPPPAWEDPFAATDKLLKIKRLADIAFPQSVPPIREAPTEQRVAVLEYIMAELLKRGRKQTA